MLPSLWSAYPEKTIGTDEGSFVYVQSTANDHMRVGAWVDDNGRAVYVTLHIGNGSLHLLYDTVHDIDTLLGIKKSSNE